MTFRCEISDLRQPADVAPLIRVISYTWHVSGIICCMSKAPRLL